MREPERCLECGTEECITTGWDYCAFQGGQGVRVLVGPERHTMMVGPPRAKKHARRRHGGIRAYRNLPRMQ